ncbi:MAG: PIN domain-containing protein [Desulfurococcales archaeon]|nr:PIN domain-containing protein [Desulfurococcales archaeon]
MSYPRIVVDTNKILAAALKPGRVRTILYQAPIRAIAPAQLLDEAERHADTLAGRAGMSREDFLLLLGQLVRDKGGPREGDPTLRRGGPADRGQLRPG